MTNNDTPKPTEAAQAAAQAHFEASFRTWFSPVPLSNSEAPAAPVGRPEPDFWAIHSKSGSHIGLWPNEDIARDILREYEGGTITPLFRAALARQVGGR